MADHDEGVTSGLSYSVLEEDAETSQPSYRPSAFINTGPAANRTTLKGCLRATVPHLLIIIIYLAYIFGGGGMFLAIQQADEGVIRDEIVHLVGTFEGMKRHLDEQLNGTGVNLTDLWDKFSHLAEAGVAEDALFKGGPELNYMRSVLYSLATISTIGTSEYVVFLKKEQAALALYALVGIPLTMFFLLDMGNLLARLVDTLYSKWCCRRGKSSRPSSIYRGTSEPVTSGNQPDLDGGPRGGSWQDTEWGRRDVPVLLVTVIWLVYFFLAGLFITISERSNYGRGLFFTFVTMTTIGLGELFTVNQTTKTYSFVACLIEMLMSLCVMSMCLILLLPKIVRFGSWISSKLNL
ncbi:TWiK family of potassium channels protein 18-like [Asterias rubens]|uniref:TWiK family of potassium channels protein 18-like n=1 Tax=Asterias rubens TaxID=7604 RepID=UPI0014552AC1|nr:TWiK family of potassium channels protein 18-like [Asterias rubens]